MRRYWLPKESFKKDKLEITGDEYHHIVKVCRMDVGSRFEVLGFDNKALFVELIEVAKKTAIAKIVDQREVSPLGKPHIHLVLSMPKFSTLDAVVEKSVEMGVKSLQPVFSDFSFVKDMAKIGAGKRKRWDKIVISATQQCGRADLMQVSEPVKLKDYLKSANLGPSKRGLFMYEGQCEQSLSEKMQELKPLDLDEVVVFVGSEGGFSNSEVELFKNNGLEAITMGDQILRVETACLAILGVIKCMLVL